MTISSPQHSPALITVKDVSHAFGFAEARMEVLHAVHVDFYPGEIAIIMGPSGSGKTTLLTLAGALRSIQSGSIVINGMELMGAPPARQLAVRHQIGFIFQAHNLLESLNALENVQMGLAHLPNLSVQEMRARSLKLLNRVGLTGHEHKYPPQLSGGQRQRVAIARALVREPSIIMADEPTAALDKASGREVVELLQGLAREMRCAILMVTHDNRILDIADRILTLEDGRIEENHRGLERAAEELASALRRIARYPSYFAPDISPVPSDAYGVFADETALALAHAHADVHALVARRLCANISDHARALAEISETLCLLEEGVREFGAVFTARPAALSRNWASPFFESLEFLLMTAAEAVFSRTKFDIETLLRLTEDRGEVMEMLRQRMYKGEAGSSKEARDYIFDLTNCFSRLIYFLHAIALQADNLSPQELSMDKKIPCNREAFT